MVVRLRWGNMVSGFLGEDLCKFRELFGEDDRGFCLFCSSGEFCSSGKSGHYWGSQDKVGVLLNDSMKDSVAFGPGNKLVFCFMV